MWWRRHCDCHILPAARQGWWVGVSRSWHRSAVREAFECEETAPGGRPGLADSGCWNSQDAPHLYKRGSSCVSLCRVPISLIKTKLELETSCKWLLVHLQANLLGFFNGYLDTDPRLKRDSTAFSLFIITPSSLAASMSRKSHKGNCKASNHMRRRTF